MYTDMHDLRYEDKLINMVLVRCDKLLKDSLGDIDTNIEPKISLLNQNNIMLSEKFNADNVILNYIENNKDKLAFNLSEYIESCADIKKGLDDFYVGKTRKIKKKCIEVNTNDNGIKSIKVFILELQINDKPDFIIAKINNNIESSIINELIEEIIEYIMNKCMEYIEYMDLNNQYLIEYMIEKDKDVSYIMNNRREYLEYIDWYIQKYEESLDYTQYFKDYIKHIYKNKIEFMINGRIHINHIMEDLNIISATPYESSYSKGELLVVDCDIDVRQSLALDIEFKDPILLKDYKGARKVLQMSTGDYIAVSDDSYIYGIVEKKKSSNYQGVKIKFNGYFCYSIELDDGNTVYFKYGYPINKNNELNISKLKLSIKNTFDDIDEEQICNLVDICKKAKEQVKGTMVVISNNAEKEAERLTLESTVIKKRKLDSSIINIIKNISAIDGCILIDQKGICYTIGTILDGKSNGIGDKTRGARYNSAIKYVENSMTNDENKCIVVVISEDGMVDIIDKNVIKNLKQHKKLTKEEFINKVYNEPIINLEQLTFFDKKWMDKRERTITIDEKYFEKLKVNRFEILYWLKYDFFARKYRVNRVLQIEKDIELIITNDYYNIPEWYNIHNKELNESKDYIWQVREEDKIIHVKHKLEVCNILDSKCSLLISFNPKYINHVKIAENKTDENFLNDLLKNRNIKQPRSYSVEWELKK